MDSAAAAQSRAKCRHLLHWIATPTSSPSVSSLPARNSALTPSSWESPIGVALLEWNCKVGVPQDVWAIASTATTECAAYKLCRTFPAHLAHLHPVTGISELESFASDTIRSSGHFPSAFADLHTVGFPVNAAAAPPTPDPYQLQLRQLSANAAAFACHKIVISFDYDQEACDPHGGPTPPNKAILSTLLLWRMQKYVPMMLETRAAWVGLEASFPPAVIEAWTTMAVAWEADSSKANPFESTAKHEDLHEVRRKLAVIASQDVEHLRVRGDMHETEMLSIGLQLEAQQYESLLLFDYGLFTDWGKQAGARKAYVDQGRRRIERETKLRRKIDAWMVVQQLFIPEVSILRDREDAERRRVAATQPLPGLRAQDMKLWIPSAIGTDAECDEPLQSYEYELRKGQAVAALIEMRDQLLLRTHEYRYRDGVGGVRAKTRSGARTKGIQAQIDSAAEEYRAARAALVKLGLLLNRSEWQQHLKPLRADDVRGGPSAVFGDDDRRKSGGKRKKKARLDPEEEAERTAARAEDKMPMSWIWLSEGKTWCTASVTLRIEWAKTRAKAMRYAEEVELLEEEMRRVLQFLDWRAKWWSSLVGLRIEQQNEEALREGHAAFKQAAYMEGLRARFEKQWKDVGSLLETARRLYAEMEVDDNGKEGEEDEAEAEVDAPVHSGWLSE
ncbi:hypothetical protein B0H14DRAFT_3852958 [Mycena olivaceomarginata]|nr:hypothetical protein B0H14DRAFT_3852958 [Mycena olivaceomarginata]